MDALTAAVPAPSQREGIEYAEQVLESIAGLYEDSRRGKEEVASRGLESIAKELNLSILRPRQKVRAPNPGATVLFKAVCQYSGPRWLGLQLDPT